jgi:hypothetical protein
MLLVAFLGEKFAELSTGEIARLTAIAAVIYRHGSSSYSTGTEMAAPEARRLDHSFSRPAI